MEEPMSRRKPIDAKILEACKEFDAHIFAETIKGEFSDFPDYRRNQKRILYPVWYLSLVILCGFFCGCNTIEEISEYAHLQVEWFSSMLGQAVTAPSHGTLWWFLVKTPPSALKSYMQKWFSRIPGSLRDQLLAIDGKRLKGATFLDNITHVVELFAADDRLCLTVEKVPDKTVEKSTLPIILEQVNVEGAIISGDAHFTVPESAEDIVDAKADYLLAVKENQPTLYAEMENFFDQAHAVEWEEVAHSFYQEVDKGHGRIETREVRVVEDLDWLPNACKWKNLACLIEVRSTRQKIGSAVSEVFRRFYITSRRAPATAFAKWTRQHWSIENKCHWIADVIFEEDKILMDRGNSAENMGLFRRLAMNMAAVVDPERGLASVRRTATFGTGYLKGILATFFCSKLSSNFS
jgi:predicted transposase YbfD/YdcC